MFPFRFYFSSRINTIRNQNRKQKHFFTLVFAILDQTNQEKYQGILMVQKLTLQIESIFFLLNLFFNIENHFLTFIIK